MSKPLAHLAKELTARSLATLYLTGHQRRIVEERARRARPVPILNLHRVATLRTDHQGTMTPDEFELLLRGLQQRYRFVSLADIDKVIESGTNEQDLVGLSFDDSYGCNFVHAVPVLRSLRIPATFFVSTDFVDSDQPFPHDARKGIFGLPNFTSGQLREIASDPLFEIGSHSASHFDFSKGSHPDTFDREMAGSRLKLEEITGKPVTRFAVPWGSLDHFTPAMLADAKSAGYRRVYSHFGGRNLVSDGLRPGYVLHRICAHGSPAYVASCLEGYRGRSSFLPGSTDRTRWPAEFHPTDIRRI